MVRNIVHAAGRMNIEKKDMTRYEKDAIDFNRKLRSGDPKIYF